MFSPLFCIHFGEVRDLLKEFTQNPDKIYPDISAASAKYLMSEYTVLKQNETKLNGLTLVMLEGQVINKDGYFKTIYSNTKFITD